MPGSIGSLLGLAGLVSTQSLAAIGLDNELYEVYVAQEMQIVQAID